MFVLQAYIDENNQNLQSLYKLDYDPRDQQIYSLKPRLYIFVNNANLQTLHESSALSVEKMTHKKLQTQTSKP